MVVISLIDVVVVFSLIIASRRRFEDALPAFCFFGVLMPIEAKLVIPGVFDLSTQRVALLTLLVLFVARGLRKKEVSIPLGYLMLLHVGWVICSTFYSLSVITSTKQVIAQVLEYYLLYYVCIHTISDVRTVYRSVYAMMIAMGLCCVLGLFEPYASWSVLRIFPSDLWVTYDSRHDPLYIEWGRGIRVRSTFPHPILFGDALAMSIPLGLYLVSISKTGWRRSVLWLVIVLMFWSIYKTSSRGPWMALGISCVLLFALVSNRVRKYLAVICLVSLTALVVRPGVWETIMNLYEQTQDSTSVVGASYDYRNALLYTITKAVAKEPARMLLGYGLGTFRELGLDIDFQNEMKHWYTCDNHWALFLYETGYVGLSIITILLLKPLVMTLRNYRRLPRPEKYLSGVFFISLSAYYFLLLSVAGYNWGQQGYMAWILISLSVVYPKLVVRRRHGNASATASPRLLCAVTEIVADGGDLSRSGR
jgi:O-Antigen ligase